MQYFDFENRKLSKIILGGDYYGTIVNEKDVYDLLDKFCYMGGNFFDTARMYTNGMSETIYGKWIRKKNRDDVFIATKGGFPYREKNLERSRLTEKDVKFDLDKSLEALKLDYVDLYYLHRDDESIPVEEIIGYLNKFVQSGKIKHIGVSNWKADRIYKANLYANKHGLNPITFSQIKYSMVKTSTLYNEDRTIVEMDNTEFETYKKMNVKIAAFASQGKGFFPKYMKNGEEGLDEKTRVRYFCKENIKSFEKAKYIAEKYDTSLASVCLLYLMCQNDIDVMPIIGCKNIEQLKDSLAGVDIKLSEKDIEYLTK